MNECWHGASCLQATAQRTSRSNGVRRAGGRMARHPVVLLLLLPSSPLGSRSAPVSRSCLAKRGEPASQRACQVSEPASQRARRASELSGTETDPFDIGV